MWRASVRPTGATVLEVLISSGLFVFVLGIVYASLQMGLDAYRRTERFATIQQQAMRGIRYVSEDLASAPRAGVSLTSGTAIVLSARRADGAVQFGADGHPMWQGWVTYRLQGGDLVRRETPISPTPDVPDPVPSLSAILAMPATEERAVAHDVTALEFVLGTTSAEVRLTASEGDPANRTLVRLLDRVFFRQ